MAYRQPHQYGHHYHHPLREVIDTQTEVTYRYGTGPIPRGYRSALGRRGLGPTSQVPLGHAHPLHVVQRSRVVREYASPYDRAPVEEEFEDEKAPTSLPYRPAPRSHAASRIANYDSNAQRQNRTPVYDRDDDAQFIRHGDPFVVPRSEHESTRRGDMTYDGQPWDANLEQGPESSSWNPASGLRAPMQHPCSAHENAQDTRYHSPSPVHRLRTGYLSGEDLRENRRQQRAVVNRSFDTLASGGTADLLAPAHSKSLAEYSPRNIRYRHVSPFPLPRNGRLVRQDLEDDGQWQGQAGYV